MNPITVVQFTAEERQPFKAVAHSLTIAYPDNRDEPEARAINALSTKGQDVTYELLVKARTALLKQRLICDRERHIEHWTKELSGTKEPITPDTPGSSMVANPYFMCETLAASRQQQYEEATEALGIVEQAMCITTPRPADPKYADI